MSQDQINNIKCQLSDVMKNIDNLSVDQKQDLIQYQNEIKENIQKQTEQFQFKQEKLIQEFNQQIQENLTQSSKIIQNKKEEQRKKLLYSEKIFIKRDSLLNVMLFQNKESEACYNFIIACLILFTLNVLIEDYTKRNLIFDYESFTKIFNKINLVTKTLLKVYLISYLCVPFCKMICDLKIKYQYALFGYILIQSLIYGLLIHTFKSNFFFFGSGAILSIETVRITLKVHSYVRNKLLYANGPNKYNQLNAKNAADLNLPKIDIQSLWIETKRYVFFFFVPTLIYRDQYKLNKDFCFQDLLVYFINFLGSVFFIFIVFKTFLLTEIELINQEQMLKNSLLQWLSICIRLAIPGIMCLTLVFFLFLHCWMNLFGELTGFQDRQFYSDWWNSPEFGTYYRKWNIVVHDFLYYYIYVDLIRFTNGKIEKSKSLIIVFMMSAFIHEIIITICIGYFYPILFIIFTGPGVILIRQKFTNSNDKILNIFFWILMMFGTGLLFCFYIIEFHARKVINDDQVIKNYGPYLQYLIPRFILMLDL